MLDRWIRTLTMHHVAESKVKLLEDENRSFIEAYADGANTCIEHEPLHLECPRKNKLPESYLRHEPGYILRGIPRSKGRLLLHWNKFPDPPVK